MEFEHAWAKRVSFRTIVHLPVGSLVSLDNGINANDSAPGRWYTHEAKRPELLAEEEKQEREWEARRAKANAADKLVRNLEAMPKLNEWTGEDPDAYIQPEYITRELDGILADDIRAALGAGPDAKVLMTEKHYPADPDDWTYAYNAWEWALECNDTVKVFGGDDEDDDQRSNMVQLLAWIDEGKEYQAYLRDGGAGALYEGMI